MSVRWDPFADMARAQDELFRSFSREGRAAAFAPPVDIVEERDAIFLHAELPGVTQEEIAIRVEDGVLTVEGERKLERKDDSRGVHRRERSYGKFTRSFSLPKTVDPSQIQASLDAGVLTLRLPKRVELQPRKITVQIGKSGESPEPRVEASAGRPRIESATESAS